MAIHSNKPHRYSFYSTCRGSHQNLEYCFPKPWKIGGKSQKIGKIHENPRKCVENQSKMTKNKQISGCLVGVIGRDWAWLGPQNTPRKDLRGVGVIPAWFPRDWAWFTVIGPCKGVASQTIWKPPQNYGAHLKPFVFLQGMVLFHCNTSNLSLEWLNFPWFGVLSISIILQDMFCNPNLKAYIDCRTPKWQSPVRKFLGQHNYAAAWWGVKGLEHIACPT